MLFSGMSDVAPGEMFEVGSESCPGINVVVSAFVLKR